MCETDRQMVDQRELLKPRRLHPAGMFFSLVKFVKETIFGLGVGVIALVRQSPKLALYFMLAFILLLLVNSVVSWFRYTYRVEDGELRIEQGIFIRKKRYISLNRIHKIDLTANVVHRLFNLTKVQIDTASSGGGAEVSLSAVLVSDAHDLRRVLKESGQDPEAPAAQMEEKPNYPQRKISWKSLFFAGTTSGSAGFILLAFIVIFSQLEEFIPETVYSEAFQWLIQLSMVLVIGLIISILLGIWAVGIAGTMLKYGNFTIENRGKELFIKRGLLETKELTIPFDRIQAIKVQESILRQPFGFVQVTAIVAGGSFDSREAFPVLFPMIRKRDIHQFTNVFLPAYDKIDAALQPLGKKGRKYYIFNSMWLFILAFFPILYFFPSYSWIPGLLVILSGLYGLFVFREGGYYFGDASIIFRSRSIWNKTTLMTFQRRIQALKKSRHKLQQLESLATTEISLIGQGGMGTHFSLRHVDNEAANKMANWYSYRKNL